MTDTAQDPTQNEIRLNPMEAICVNVSCPAVLRGRGAENPPPLDRQTPHFHHVMLVRGSRSGLAGFSLPHCPVCGEPSLKPTPFSGVPDPDAKFPLGLCSMTAGVERLITAEVPPSRPGLPALSMVDGKLRTELFRLTQAHARGEWPEADQARNEEAIKPEVQMLADMDRFGVEFRPRPFVLERGVVFSQPELNGQTVLIVTEAARHRTAAMLPEERDRR